MFSDFLWGAPVQGCRQEVGKPNKFWKSLLLKYHVCKRNWIKKTRYGVKCSWYKNVKFCVFLPCEIIDKIKIIRAKHNHNEIMGDYISWKTFPPLCPLRQMARIWWHKGSNHDFCAAHSTEWAPSQCLLVHWFSKGIFVLLCTCSNHTNVASEQNLEIKINLCFLDIALDFIQSLFLGVFILVCDVYGHVMGWLPEHYSLPSKNSSKIKIFLLSFLCL